MPEGSQSHETNSTGSPELSKLANKIGEEAAREFSEAQATALLDNPAMHGKLDNWSSQGFFENLEENPSNREFIAGLARLAQKRVDADSGVPASSPARAPAERVANASTDNKESKAGRVWRRVKGMGRAGLVGLVAGGAIATGIGGFMALNDDKRQGIEYVHANDIETQDIAPTATEAEKIKFFDIGPSTHDQTKETETTKDDFNFRPTREALFNYDGSEASIQAIVDDMSDMFRRDVRIQAAWASALKIEGAPQIPSVQEMQNEKIFYQYHQDLYAFTDRMARDINFRTDVYSQMMDTLQESQWSQELLEATQDQVSVQHDGNKVSIAKRVGDRGRDAQHVQIEGTSKKGEKIVALYKVDCGQWMLVVGNIEIPAPEIINLPRDVYFPPPPTEVPPQWTTPPVTETPPPTTRPPTPQPPRTTTVPKNPRDIPYVAPEAPRGYAPPVVTPAAPPPPPPPPRYEAPSFQIPDFGNLIRDLAPGASPSTGIWERGQGSAPSIPRNPNLSPPSSGDRPGMNSGMVGE